MYKHKTDVQNMEQMYKTWNRCIKHGTDVQNIEQMPKMRNFLSFPLKITSKQFSNH